MCLNPKPDIGFPDSGFLNRRIEVYGLRPITADLETIPVNNIIVIVSIIMEDERRTS